MLSDLVPLCPFAKASELCAALDSHDRQFRTIVPGYPRLNITDHAALVNFLEKQLISPDLERMAPRLWWMSKQDSANISPLHRQRVKKRAIVVAEDPKLHLVWIQDRIFIKPLPEYLLSHAFWEGYLSCGHNSGAADPRLSHIRRTALGFLRTYFYLIQHESDFRIAQGENNRLIPTRISWEQFCAFSSDFDKIRDSDVTERYSYGEIRLTRLNFYGKFLLRKWHYQRVEPQYGDYFARFYGPILFFLGVLSVFLSALQVELGVEQVNPLSSWLTFRHLSRVLSIASLLGLTLLMLVLGGLLIYKVAKEWQYALRDRRLLKDLKAGNAKCDA
ncbi:hypothetical protein MMC25_005903 [Agyrium rufum]|nr:hypothetical protein [Agyrium rufum]